MPTFFEKFIRSPGDGYGLRITDTPYSRISGLICGGNYQSASTIIIDGTGGIDPYFVMASDLAN